MTRRIAMVAAAAAALAASALPAAAADLYGYGGEPSPGAYGRGGPDGYGFRGDAGGEGYGRRGALEGEGYARRRGPGPVVFDERGGYERRGAFVAEGGPDLPPPPRPYGRPDGFGPGPRGFEAGDGGGFRPAPFYRPAAARFGPAFGDGFGVPQGGCTVERARSITPAGWQKTVTRRTCYGR